MVSTSGSPFGLRYEFVFVFAFSCGYSTCGCSCKCGDLALLLLLTWTYWGCLWGHRIKTYLSTQLTVMGAGMGNDGQLWWWWGKRHVWWVTSNTIITLVSYQPQCVQLPVCDSFCVDMLTIYPCVIILLLGSVMHYIYLLAAYLQWWETTLTGTSEKIIDSWGS